LLFQVVALNRCTTLTPTPNSRAIFRIPLSLSDFWIATSFGQGGNTFTHLPHPCTGFCDVGV